MIRSPRAAWVAALVAVLAIALSLPSASPDLYADDLSMVLRLEGTAPTPRGRERRPATVCPS